MPSQYCPACGFKHTYELTKPVKCEKCNKSFANAFKVTVAPAPVQPSTTYSPVWVPPLAQASYTRPEEPEEDTYFNRDKIRAHAQQMLRDIDVNDIVVVANSPQAPEKMGNLVRFVEPEPARKTRSKKSRK